MVAERVKKTSAVGGAGGIGGVGGLGLGRVCIS